MQMMLMLMFYIKPLIIYSFFLIIFKATLNNQPKNTNKAHFLCTNNEKNIENLNSPPKKMFRIAFLGSYNNEAQLAVNQNNNKK